MSWDVHKYHRKSIRLAGHNYANAGAYYITQTVFNRRRLFGNIADGVMQLNALGEIVRDEWQRTGTIRPECELDTFVVMPDHFHAIIWIHDTPPDPGKEGVRGTPLRATWDAPVFPISIKSGPDPRSLGAIMAGFKSACTRRINTMRSGTDPVWQRDFYERIIRTEMELNRVRQYIHENPIKWKSGP